MNKSNKILAATLLTALFFAAGCTKNKNESIDAKVKTLTYNSSASPSVTVTENYSYDSEGRLVLKEESNGNRIVVNYTYTTATHSFYNASGG